MLFDFLFKKKDNTALQAVIKDHKTVIIDVRTRGEYMGGHVVDSLNIPLDEIPQNVEKIKKMATSVVLCCRSGNRSSQAETFLKSKGLENLYDGGSWTNVNNLKNN